MPGVVHGETSNRIEHFAYFPVLQIRVSATAGLEEVVNTQVRLMPQLKHSTTRHERFEILAIGLEHEHTRISRNFIMLWSYALLGP
ncbi:MAG: hypothetical protein CL912_04535 [Deltaproteobacteria bacterium]|nr:hypothetical protein [Deltaproteobacteria bacterium]